ncbi:MAG: 23S rRNA (guanosine(2251)-2'-O)-methyltransferase RlmB [Candidatus Marinimicrobia bacterium]|jgi:23S rRNA (guanosine2251-2'-O)-methyltransferase|nr:23S rRNA (guanosine(2251)-2'-O)-methyltransferase RlmB [Candidatus Neomarinimicrobiota bacterium]MBT5097417.1 23S rRNA (guanosine(2251)-2'-O)-methyltransferase RlmB [Candidatus Neomarinimicrobiota bacterium]MBT5440363.1 23S rRNA (guanosine(2251)-2'-O)-methyltransferase RlmB [Candidatus Neomarinimicrobiota bacterium]
MGKNQHTIYGINGSAAILSSKNYKIIDIFIQSGSPAERDGNITRALGQHGGHIKFLKPTHFKSKYSKWRTQGIVVTFNGIIEQSIPSFKNKTGNIGLLILDRIEDPQNMGQIIRTAECAGIEGIIIPKHESCGVTDTVIQVSQGAFTQMPIYEVNNLHQTITNLKSEDFWVIAMENSLKAKEWHKIDYSGKVVIIVGSEGRGIKNILLEKSDFKATIPMEGKTNSLNVSAAVSAVTFERLRQISS